MTIDMCLQCLQLNEAISDNKPYIQKVHEGYSNMECLESKVVQQDSFKHLIKHKNH